MLATWEIFLCVYICVLIAISTISTILFYERRHYHPLKGRNPMVVVFGNISLLPLLVFPLVGLFGGYPCVISLFLLQPVYAIGPSMILLRGITLLFQFEITRDLLLGERILNGKHKLPSAALVEHSSRNNTTTTTIHGERGSLAAARRNNNNNGNTNNGHNTASPAPLPTSWKPSWWTRNRWIIKPRSLRRIQLVHCAIWAIVIIPHYNSYHWPHECNNTDHGDILRTTRALDYGILGLMALLLIGIAWRLRQHDRDGHMIKQEFKIISIILTVGVGCAALLSFIFAPNDKYASAAISVWQFLIPSIVAGVIITSTVWPLWLSYIYERRERDQLAAMETAERVTHLTEFLTYNGAYELFLRFCSAEFNSENLLFYKRVVDLQFSPSNDARALLVECQQIYSAYLAVSSPFELNVAGETRRIVANHIEALRKRVGGSAANLPSLPSPTLATAVTMTPPNPFGTPTSVVAAALGHRPSTIMGGMLPPANNNNTNNGVSSPSAGAAAAYLTGPPMGVGAPSPTLTARTLAQNGGHGNGNGNGIAEGNPTSPSPLHAIPVSGDTVVSIPPRAASSTPPPSCIPAKSLGHPSPSMIGRMAHSPANPAPLAVTLNGTTAATTTSVAISSIMLPPPPPPTQLPLSSTSLTGLANIAAQGNGSPSGPSPVPGSASATPVAQRYMLDVQTMRTSTTSSPGTTARTAIISLPPSATSTMTSAAAAAAVTQLSPFTPFCHPSPAAVPTPSNGKDGNNGTESGFGTPVGSGTQSPHHAIHHHLTTTATTTASSPHSHVHHTLSGATSSLTHSGSTIISRNISAAGTASGSANHTNGGAARPNDIHFAVTTTSSPSPQPHHHAPPTTHHLPSTMSSVHRPASTSPLPVSPGGVGIGALGPPVIHDPVHIITPNGTSPITSPTEINDAQIAHDNLCHEIKHIFDDVQLMVLKLLEGNSFPRFRASKHFQLFVEQQTKHAQERLHREARSVWLSRAEGVAGSHNGGSFRGSKHDADSPVGGTHMAAAGGGKDKDNKERRAGTHVESKSRHVLRPTQSAYPAHQRSGTFVQATHSPVAVRQHSLAALSTPVSHHHTSHVAVAVSGGGGDGTTTAAAAVLTLSAMAMAANRAEYNAAHGITTTPVHRTLPQGTSSATALAAHLVANPEADAVHVLSVHSRDDGNAIETSHNGTAHTSITHAATPNPITTVTATATTTGGGTGTGTSPLGHHRRLRTAGEHELSVIGRTSRSPDPRGGMVVSAT